MNSETGAFEIHDMIQKAKSDDCYLLDILERINNRITRLENLVAKQQSEEKPIGKVVCRGL